ncbi:MAG: hypothetical protein SH850_15470 [Planctomycetaceae bacterium]|nr:hypothetical protein [Planctomycetaceae bacterium]
MVMGFAANGSGSRAGVAMLLAIAGALFLQGCGGEPPRPKPVPVKGTVTFRGKPLAKARVTFYGKGAPMPATGETNDAGAFELSMYAQGDGALAGENKVTLDLISSGGDSTSPPDATKLAMGGASTPLKAEIGKKTDGGVTLPKNYSNSSNTPLTVTVKPEGETDLKLELK